MESSKLGANNLASDDRQRLFRIVRRILATAFLLLALTTYYLWRQYRFTRPTFMDMYQDSGQFHPLYMEGWAVYLTRADQFRLYGSAVAAVACLVGTVALDAFVLTKPGKKESDG